MQSAKSFVFLFVLGGMKQIQMHVCIAFLILNSEVME